MKFPRTYQLEEIAKIIDCDYIGSADFEVQGINEIHVVTPGDIVFVDHPKYYDKALESAATIVLINKKVPCPKGKALLISDDPFRDFNKITKYFVEFTAFAKADLNKFPGSHIAQSAIIGSGSFVQPGAIIGNDVVIGKNTIIHANVVINDRCIIGDNVIIHSGAVLGGDAFYYKRRSDGYDKLLSGGRVVIGNNVEIGVNCTIDRGVTADTTIDEGTKIDNLVQVGHDTVIGKHCLIASQAGIAGCVVIEDEVKIWGKVGFNSGITIGKGAEILACSCVSKDVLPGKRLFGIPAMDVREKFKEMASIKKIPQLIEQVKNK